METLTYHVSYTIYYILYHTLYIPYLGLILFWKFPPRPNLPGAPLLRTALLKEPRALASASCRRSNLSLTKTIPGDSYMVPSWTPKVCRIMASLAVYSGFGPLFYIPCGSRLLVMTCFHIWDYTYQKLSKHSSLIPLSSNRSEAHGEAHGT